MNEFHLDRLWPNPQVDLELDVAFADLALPDPPADRPSVAINMVTSIDGRAQVAGGAEGLGSRVDRRLMRLLRAGFDAVGNGAGTIRAAGFWPQIPDDLAARRVEQGRPPQPTSVVIAGSTPVPIEKWHGNVQPRILIVGRDNPQVASPGVELLRAPTPDPDPAWVLARLHERGIRSVLLEGGPTTNAAFLARSALDEVFWTLGASVIASDALSMIAPISGGSPWADDPRRGSLVSVHRHGDELFLRYRFVAGGSIGR